MPDRPRARHRRRWAAICSLLAFASLGADQPPGLLFYASFDSGPKADFAVGRADPYLFSQPDARERNARFRSLPGAFGQGVTGVMGSFQALGNVLPERGTIAFFARLLGPDLGADPLQVRTLDWYYWRTYLRASREGQSLAAAVADEAFALDLGARGPAGELLVPDRWRHVAIAWDQAYGLVLYLDGVRVRSTWGERSWLSRGVDPEQLMLAWADGSIAYDELWIFDRALGDEQVRALAKRNRAPGARELPALEFDARRRANRLRELGWGEGGATVRLALDARGSGALAVRQIIPRDARALKAEAGAVFDGKLGQGWPLPWRYEFNGGNGLSVELGEDFDAAVLEGRFRGKVYAGRHLTEPAAAPLHVFEPGTYRTHWNLTETRSGWLSFFWSGSERERQIAEIGFFRSGVPEPESSSRARWFLTGQPAAQQHELLAIDLAGRFGPGDRQRLGATREPPPRAQYKLAGLRFHHVLIPARQGDWGLRAMRLVLDLRGDLAGLPLRAELRDPLYPGRRLAAFDVELGATAQLRSGHVELLLDLDGRVVPADRPLWVVLVPGREVELALGGPTGSHIELLEQPLGEVVPGFVERELPVVRSLFRQLSEKRPWVWYERPERELSAFNLAARELFAPLELLHRLTPEEPHVAALWLWTHPRQELRGPLEVQAVPGHAGAPLWALWQRELYQRSRKVLDWWIEHRQVPSGEFGDDWNDDTDLVQNVPALALLADPGGRLRASVRAVADGVYAAGRIRGGLNTRLLDPLHAYEEGMNAQQVMALLAPGDPLYLERLMESARAIDERLMRSSAPGRRVFRSSRFGADRIDEGAWARDSVRHSVLLGPALSVAYYDRNPRAIRMVQEWVDGWLDAYPSSAPVGRIAQPPFPSARLPDGKVVERDWLPRGWGYVSLFPALYALTGDARYREVTRYWTGEFSGGAFLEHVPEVHHALELLGSDQRRALLRWSRGAELAHVAADDLGDLARRRLLESELTGKPGPAIEALSAGVYRLRALREAFTWAEPIADRIWLPSAPLAVMSQGGLSHERNQLWPQHHVSYEGFSDLAAWVREKSETHLRIWLYSFAPGVENGGLRLWRLAPGSYRVRAGLDGDADGMPDGSQSTTQALARFAVLPLRLEPGQLIALDIELQGKARDAAPRPDLALSASVPPSREGLEVTVHNLGSAAATDIAVWLLDPRGTRVAQRRIASLEAPTDLLPRRQRLRFPEALAGTAWILRADPESRIAELNETNNELLLAPR